MSRVADLSRCLIPALAIVALAMVVTAQAIVWNVPGVPGPPDTIQQAINMGSSGDTIIVDGPVAPADPDKVYDTAGFFNVDFGGKNIEVVGGGIRPWGVIIDCNQQGRAFIFQSGETAISPLKPNLSNLVILNGYAKDPAWPQDASVDPSGYGGAIYVKNSTPRIENCRIFDCRADAGGGAIFCDEGGNARITNCEIAYNFGGRGLYEYGLDANDINDVNAITPLGGAIYCKKSDPLISNCLIIYNRVAGSGGGVACEDSNAVVVACFVDTNNTPLDPSDDVLMPGIYENDAWANSNIIMQHGGGIYCKRGAPIIYDSWIAWNDARWSGGGIAAGDGQLYLGFPGPTGPNFPTLVTDNHSWASGGGVYCEGNPIADVNADPNSDPNLTNSFLNHVLIAYNYGYWSGGMSANERSRADMNYVTIADNVASWSWLVGGLECYGGFATVTNSIFWNNTGVQILPPDVNVTFSDVQVLDINGVVDPDPNVVWPGTGNINQDPLFIAPLRRDYRLMNPLDMGFTESAAMAMLATEGAGLLSAEAEGPPTSPCINAGNPMADYSLEPAPNGNRVNMGAYGGMKKAERSDVKRPVPGDIDANLEVTWYDFAVLADNWLLAEAAIKNKKADLDNNGRVDADDLLTFARFWLWQQ